MKILFFCITLLIFNNCRAEYSVMAPAQLSLGVVSGIASIMSAFQSAQCVYHAYKIDQKNSLTNQNEQEQPVINYRPVLLVQATCAAFVACAFATLSSICFKDFARSCKHIFAYN